MKVKDFFDNLNVFFNEDEGIDDPSLLEGSAQVFAYAYKDEEGEIYEIRVFNPEYKEMLIIDENGKVEPLSLEK